MTRKGFCIGHYEKKSALDSKVSIFIFTRNALINNEMVHKYKVRITFFSPKKFEAVKEMLSPNYSSKDYYAWEMEVFKDEIFPELLRLKNKGFIINQEAVSEFLSEMV